MKRILNAKYFLLVLLSLATLFLVTSTISAQAVTTTIDESEFEGGEAVLLNSAVSNDAFLAGEDVTVEADIEDNAFLAGGVVRVDSVIGNNAFIAGGQLLLNGPIEGDAFVAGGYVVINGNIEGDLRIAAETLHLNGDVAGELHISASEVFLAEESTITGDQSIQSGRIVENVTSPELTLENAPSYNMEFDFKGFEKALAGIGIVWLLGASIGSLLMGYVILRLFPVFSEKAIQTATDHPLESVVSGIVVLAVAPILSILLLISIVGIQVWVLLAALAGVAFMFGNTYAAYISGRYVLKKFGYENTGRFIVLLVGVLLVNVGLGLLQFIPLVGALIGLVTFTLTMLGLGGILYSKYLAFTTNKK